MMTASPAASIARFSLFHGNVKKITVGRLTGCRQSASGFQPERRSETRLATRRSRLSVRPMSSGEPMAASQSLVDGGPGQ
jgi:hypothetical protein